MRGLTDEQLQERLKYITATDAPVVCNFSPWKNKIELWKEKVGLSEQEDISCNPAVKAGLYLEAPIAEWFSDETNLQLETDEKLAVHKSIPYLAAHTDRVIVGESALLECKTASRSDGWGDQGENIVPKYYLIQGLHELMCFDKEVIYFAVLIQGRDFRYYRFERNAKLEEKLITLYKDFWDCVTNEIAPEATTPDEVSSLYCDCFDDDKIIADADTKSLIESLRKTNASIKSLQNKKLEIQDKIKLFMRDKTLLTDINDIILCSWKTTKPVKRLDTSKMKKEALDIYKQFTVEYPGQRRFLVRGGEDE